MSEEFDDDEILDDEEFDLAGQEELEEHREEDEALSRRIQARDKHDTVMEDMAAEDELDALLDPDEDTPDLYPPLSEKEEQQLRADGVEIVFPVEEEEEPPAGIRSGGDGTTIRHRVFGNYKPPPEPRRRTEGFQYPSMGGKMGPGKMIP